MKSLDTTRRLYYFLADIYYDKLFELLQGITQKQDGEVK